MGTLEFAVGSGFAAVGEGSGAATYDVVNGAAGGALIVTGFHPGVDRVNLQGYAPDAATVATGPAATQLTLTDGTKISFLGVTDLGGSLVAVGS